MPTLKEIKKELETIKTIKNIVNVYYEIANLRMKEIKERVLRNRGFFKELIKIYQKIKLFSEVEINKKENTNKKFKVLVFLSANEFLYGSLILEIWKMVQEYLEKEKGDLVVIGKTGKYLAERLNLKITYFHLDDVRLKKEEVEEVVRFIKNYQRILVFYGKYFGGLIQKPEVEEISPKIEMEKRPPGFIKRVDYIFEPSLTEILDFFENEILGVLFTTAILEHQLARYAARVISMSEATDRAKKMENEILKKESNFKRKFLTKKQIEFFNSIIS